jgi:cell filamentation protein
VTVDPYVYEGTDVLINVLGIHDAEELRDVESQVALRRIARLTVRKLPGRYDLRHLMAFHQWIFTGIYPWAGQLRTVQISKPGTTFALAQRIGVAAKPIFDDIAERQFLTGLTRARFVEQLAHALGDVNALHPFREGNGRAQRAFFRQLAADAGYNLDWTRRRWSRCSMRSRRAWTREPTDRTSRSESWMPPISGTPF